MSYKAGVDSDRFSINEALYAILALSQCNATTEKVEGHKFSVPAGE